MKIKCDRDKWISLVKSPKRCSQPGCVVSDLGDYQLNSEDVSISFSVDAGGTITLNIAKKAVNREINARFQPIIFYCIRLTKQALQALQIKNALRGIDFFRLAEREGLPSVIPVWGVKTCHVRSLCSLCISFFCAFGRLLQRSKK